MTKRHHSSPRPLPRIWLVSDARNDAALEQALKRLPRGSGLIYRHYHLPETERRARFEHLRRIARARGHRVCLAGSPRLARRWGAYGAYGADLATAHSLEDLRRARRARAVLLSPVFPTRSHPAAKPLGPLRFRLIAAWSPVPVIALGGMDARNARRLQGFAWAAIDGLSESVCRPGARSL